MTWEASAKTWHIDNEEILHAKLYKCDGTIRNSSIKIYKDCQYNNDDGSFEIAECNNMMFIRIENQLGNCLRVITSALIIAEYFNKNVYIDMKNSPLFEKERTIISALFPNICVKVDKHKYKELRYDDYVIYDKFPATNYDLICEGRFVPFTKDNFAITATIYSIIPDIMETDEYIRRKIAIYKSIKYPDFLIDNVANFILNAKYDIAFHIRYGDNLNHKTKLHLNTNLEIFIDKLDEFQDKKVLICSDNRDILDSMSKRENVILVDRCSNPIFQPLYEMILLSNAKKIIGSTSSTFSYESAFMNGGTDIELFEEREWRLYELGKYKK